MSRHDPRIRQEDDARRRLRAGIAKVALRHLRTRPAVDAYHQPLRHAAEMSERHNERTLERWAEKRGRTIVSLG